MFRFLAIFAVCVISVAAKASDWVEIFDDDEVVVSVNTVDLKKQRLKGFNSIGAWMKTTYKTPMPIDGIANGKPIAKFLSMNWYQCQNRKSSDSVEVAFYGTKGEFLDSYSEETSLVDFRHVAPDTIESNIQTVVCVVDLSNQIDTKKMNGGMSDYYYRQLKLEYPYEFKLLKDYKDNQ